MSSKSSKFRHAIVSAGTPIAYNTGALTGPQELSEIRINSDIASGVPEELLTVTLDSADGAAYDMLILRQDMDIVRYLLITDLNMELDEGDALVVAYANTAARNMSMRIVLK